MAEEQQIHDVIVIGAGVSGLSSAKVLADNGADVLVLEARNRVGGRTYTVQNDTVGWVDIGGAYVGRTQNHLLRMIKDLNLSIYPVNEKQKIVFLNGWSGKRTLYNYWETPGFDFLTLLDINYIMRLIDEMGEEIPVEAPWNAPHAEQWDRMTFKEFVESNITNKTAIEFMRIFIATCVTNEPFSSSTLWFLWYVKQCGGSLRIFSTTNGGQEFKVYGGTNQITQRLANLIGNERVILESPVCYVQQSDNIVTVRTLQGREYKGKFLIMATPPAVQQKIHYEPALPALRNQLIQRAPMGSVFKCIVYYERAFWRDSGLCGSLIFIGDDLSFPITYTLDDSKPDGSKPAIIGFIVAEKAFKMTELTKDQRLKIVTEAYAKGFGTEEAKKAIHYEEHNWSAEQYSGGCYTATFGPGAITQFREHLRKPIGRMYFAGTECATEWSGYINGGIQAGERTARQVLVELGKLSANQIDQVEPVSLDYPPLPLKATLFERYAPSAKGFVWGLTITGVVAVAAATSTAVYFKCPLTTNVINKLFKA